MNRHFGKRMSGWVAYVCMPLILSAVVGLILFAGLYPVGQVMLRSANMLTNGGEVYAQGDGSPILSDGERNEVLKETTESETQEEKEVVEEPNIGDAYGHIVCERIGIDAPVYFGDNSTVLLQGIGTYPSSWVPGCGKTTLLSGHNDMAFKTLGNVAVGDEFTITTDYGTYEYKVSDFKIVNETEIEACRLDSDTEQVVLYTCYPFYRISGRRTERFFVYLEKLSGPEIELINYFLKD